MRAMPDANHLLMPTKPRAIARWNMQHSRAASEAKLLDTNQINPNSFASNNSDLEYSLGKALGSKYKKTNFLPDLTGDDSRNQTIDQKNQRDSSNMI